MSAEKAGTTIIATTINVSVATTINTIMGMTTRHVTCPARDTTTITLTINRGKPYQLKNSTTEISTDTIIQTPANKITTTEKPILSAAKHQATTEALAATNPPPSFRTKQGRRLDTNSKQSSLLCRVGS
jgi:hypothetical protein